MKKFTFLLSVSATLCSVASFAQFGSSSLDVTFGNGGKVETPAALKDSSTKMALQSDGKILVVGTADQDGTPNYGDFKIARYNTDGTLDIFFGTNGNAFNFSELL